MSKVDLAKQLEVTDGYIRLVEIHRARPPTLRRCQQIADALSLSNSERKRLLQLATLERASEETKPFLKFKVATEPSFSKEEEPIYRVPVIGRARASSERGHLSLEPVEGEFIEWKGCKAVEMTTNAMAPLVYRGQKIIYTEVEEPREGDLVFCKLRSGEQFLKRYRRNHKKRLVALESASPGEWEASIPLDEAEIEWCYKILGVRF
jgi:phage repressor protein C with HTH and peptisase S24 domain